MNEEYLKGYFNTYVLPKKQDATYYDWVSKIKDNEQYKQGMFNTYVLPKKQTKHTDCQTGQNQHYQYITGTKYTQTKKKRNCG